MAKLPLLMPAKEQVIDDYHILTIKSADRLVVRNASNKVRKKTIAFFKTRKREDTENESILIWKEHRLVSHKRKSVKASKVKKRVKSRKSNAIDHNANTLNKLPLCYSQLIIAAYQANPMRIRTLPSKRYQCRCKKHKCPYCRRADKQHKSIADEHHYLK